MKNFTLCFFLLCFVSQTVLAQCSTYVQQVYSAIENCVLLLVVGTQQKLKPCAAPYGFHNFGIGEYAYIDYQTSHDHDCVFTCHTGQPVEITCMNFSTGIENQKEDTEIYMYPTMTDAEVTLEGKDLKKAEFFNSEGSLVLTINNLIPGVMDVSNLLTGFYFVRISAHSATRLFKLSKI